MADKNLNSLNFGTGDTYYLNAGNVKYDSSETFSDGTVGASLTEQSQQIAQKDLVDESVFNTVQELVLNSSGQVSQILHKRNGTAYRTDTFTYAENSITESRTIASIGTLTIVTNLTTLATTVAFTAA